MKLQDLNKYCPKGLKCYKSLHVRILTHDDKYVKVIPIDATLDEKNTLLLDLADFKEDYEEIS